MGCLGMFLYGMFRLFCGLFQCSCTGCLVVVFLLFFSSFVGCLGVFLYGMLLFF